ncbi:nucleoside diphosphate-linked moiety X motif 13 isoform X1 [Girardinichthys multiradiatus]|uniref:nucleoside diphosphate-linked moiety X motif 13 isoform X1 n=3 Tax=Girardinichthys multiradiatus TaxID=208333 RepID=UPI001FAD277B|nr:nucleoside diphosphate-linked moiety X motif 13 isoform X1 [Girardinichthys multiradiatus]XP_047232475.1 nucleoside diphosphate-linked moiety X motif 13 isoform X1 [Girardinichthys multiradiatus]XP_047232476.1 nucleoside diphosphate-linked moiety X motif 13 isoform X1 [Girardinichthys multiradiatus]
MLALLRPLRILRFAEHYSLTRFCSAFVSRMRYLNMLKENDAACVSALQNGHIFLFHHLIPLLQRSDPGTFRSVALSYSEVQSVLHRSGSDGSLLKESILIGCSEQNQAQFCLDVGKLDPAAVAKECKGTFIDLRKAFFLLAGAEAHLVAKAQALLRWHQINRFSGATGQLTHRNQAGSQRVCSSSSIVYYPKMSPVVIVLVSDGKRCLLGRQSSFPIGLYSALAGFCDMGETLEEAVSREVAEEVGLEVQNIIYSSSQHWPFPHSSFMLSCHATVSSAHSQLNVDHLELEDARWFTEEEITCALQVMAPPKRVQPTTVWLPPKHAVAHRLIMEWRDSQQRSEGTE